MDLTLSRDQKEKVRPGAFSKSHHILWGMRIGSDASKNLGTLLSLTLCLEPPSFPSKFQVWVLFSAFGRGCTWKWTRFPLRARAEEHRVEPVQPVPERVSACPGGGVCHGAGANDRGFGGGFNTPLGSGEFEIAEGSSLGCADGLHTFRGLMIQAHLINSFRLSKNVAY